MQIRKIDLALILAACTLLPASFAADKTSAAEIGQSAGQYVDDAALTTKVKTALLTDSLLSVFEIKVDSDKGQVTLSGNVDKAENIERAVRLASAVPGVRHVHVKLQAKN